MNEGTDFDTTPERLHPVSASVRSLSFYHSPCSPSSPPPSIPVLPGDGDVRRTRPLPVWLHNSRCAFFVFTAVTQRHQYLLQSDTSQMSIACLNGLNTGAPRPALFEVFPQKHTCQTCLFSVRGDKDGGFCQRGTSSSLINGPPKDSVLIMRTPADNMEEGVFIIIRPRANIGRLPSCLAGERLIARRHLSDWLF